MVNRTKYTVMIGFGFGIAVLVGLWVAIQVSAGQPLSGLLGIVLLGFIPSALFSGYGAYQYSQVDVEPDVIPDVDVRHQRELVDLIHERGMISIADASHQLGISEHHVRDAIRQLLELGIFTGDVDWNEDVLYSQKTQKLN
jgi:hypothetical protein